MSVRIVFVCTGNICRSPMAEALFKKSLQERLGDQASEIAVSSAGLAAISGNECPSLAIDVMSKRDVDISAHRARIVDLDMIEQADLVLTMEVGHANRVLEVMPKAIGKVFTLKEFTSGKEIIREVLKSCDDIAANNLPGRTRNRIDRVRKHFGDSAAKEGSVPPRVSSSKDIANAERNRIRLADFQQKLAQFDVTDPIGKGYQAYEECAEELEKEAYKLVDMLISDG